MTDAERLRSAYDHCGTLLREHDKDRFLANLFLPAAVRPHVTALHAFSLEIARIRDVVREPMAGELRHQWWRDALSGDGLGDVGAHPVAAALIDTVRRFNLPRDTLIALIDARGFDLYDDPMPSLAALEAYCHATSSSLFDLAGRIAAGAPSHGEAADHAGLAYAFTGLIRALPRHAARGQVFLPTDFLDRHGASSGDIVSGRATPALLDAVRAWREMALGQLDRARAGLAGMAAGATPAFRPLALVRPYLRLADARGYDPFRTALDLPQWRRQWALLRG